MLPLQPASAFAVGRYAHVPLLQGTNHDEGRFFVGFGFDVLGKPLTAAQSRTRRIGADRRPGTDRPISADGTFPRFWPGPAPPRLRLRGPDVIL